MTWTPEEDAEFRAVVDGTDGTVVPIREQPDSSSWAPVHLASIVEGVLAGEIVGPVPTLMPRTDGVSLLYPGEVASLAGEPETGKGLITLSEVARLVNQAARVLYLDFEDSAASIVKRLLALGARDRAIVDCFTYVRPVDPLSAGDLDQLTREHYELVILDGLSEAYGLLGLDISDNADAVRFLATLPRPLAAAGAAVLMIDHVAKAKDSRGRYAIGAQHKLAGIATAFTTDVIKPPSRQTEGLINLKVEKDRHGHVRGHASQRHHVIALARITPEDDGERITVQLEPPEVSTDAEGNFRPTAIMEKVSRFLEEEPGANSRMIRGAINSQGAYVDTAVRILINEGFIDRQQNGQARRHFNLREYREGSENE